MHEKFSFGCTWFVKNKIINSILTILNIKHIISCIRYVTCHMGFCQKRLFKLIFMSLKTSVNHTKLVLPSLDIWKWLISLRKISISKCHRLIQFKRNFLFFHSFCWSVYLIQSFWYEIIHLKWNIQMIRGVSSLC